MNEDPEFPVVRDRESLADFVDELRYELANGANSDIDIQTFLESMSAWLRDSRGLERNTGQDFDGMQNWLLVARVLNAAVIYS